MFKNVMGEIIGLTHSILSAEPFFPGFCKFSSSFFNFKDLTIIAMQNLRIAAHNETLKHNFEKLKVNEIFN